MFEVGEKVICVNNKPWELHWDPPSHIQEGVVYTIKGFSILQLEQPYQVVYLKEFSNTGFDSSGNYLIDLGYIAGRFRKLIKKKQSIEIFNVIRKKVENNAHIYSVIPQDELEKYLN